MSSRGAARLPDGIIPTCYEIDLTVKPGQKKFFGSVSIKLSLESPIKALSLHALDLEITHVALGAIKGEATNRPSSEMIELSFSETCPSGETSLSLSFSGTLNKQMRGLYETGVGVETFAFTQFQATDARRMFPCFDEPARKARFCLSVTIPADLVALSNMPITEDRIEGETRKVSFAETPVMSTYLLALAVARLEKKDIILGKMTVTVWALPNQVKFGTFALKVAEAVIPLLNDYFDFPCPTLKLDFVCVPDFAMGAMENWGAIFFRDSCLLIDAEASSIARQRAVASIITHEIVHQWFGNLVTMVWWDDLWLNESFATWLSCKIIDQWRPDWRVWLSFQQEKEIPLGLDALKKSRAIQAEVESPAEIEEMFDALTYEKGAACLRMFEQFLGEESFRKGIRVYIKQHQYSNATASDLWDALASTSPHPVAEIAKDWFTRPGYPIITIHPIGDGFSRLRLTQQRFTSGEEPSLPWPVPFMLRYRDDEGIHTKRMLLKKHEDILHLKPTGNISWAYGNAGETGFYRTTYSPELLRILTPLAATQLESAERVGFLANFWALCRRGDLPISSFMKTLGYFREDSLYAVVEDICSYLEILYTQLVQPSDRALFSTFVYQQLNPIWKNTGWDVIPGESDEKKLVRSNLLWTLGAIAQDEEILSELPRRQTRFFARSNSIDPTLVPSLIRLCARSDGGTRFEKFLERVQNSTTPESRDQFLLALADFNKPALARRVIDFACSDKVRSQDSWKPIKALIANPFVQGEAWEYLKINWRPLKIKVGSIGAQRLIQSLGNLWSIQWYDDVRDFFNHPENSADLGQRTLAQTLEFIQIGVQFKDSQVKDLSEWLHDNVEVGSMG